MQVAVKAPAAERLSGLDALRSLAILHVVLAHGAMTFMPSLPGLAGKAVWLLIATNFGVPLFFVLSGFLIARQLAGGMPAAVFYRHRLAKIYPTFFLSVVVFGLLSGVADAKVWLLHLAALHNVNAVTASQMSGHLWSLAVELQFYALAPLLFVLAYRWLNVRTVIALGLLVWIRHALLLWSVPATQGARLAAVMDVYESTSFNIFALIMGGLLYRAYAGGWRWSWAVPVGGLAAAGMPLICALVLPSLQVHRVDLTQNTLLMLVLLLIALPPVASVCLTYLTLTRRWFQGARLRQWTAWVASISYQWYLWHPLVLIGFHRAALRWPGFDAWTKQAPWIALLAYGALSVALAWLGYVGVERPAHRWLLGRGRDRTHRPGMPASG